jgi:hypothetical protein
MTLNYWHKPKKQLKLLPKELKEVFSKSGLEVNLEKSATNNEI